MAREIGNGVWYSKLGDEQDIRHHVFDAVENEIYGEARYFMSRPLNQECCLWGSAMVARAARIPVRRQARDSNMLGRR